jgi:tetratricopeptide (TPR) repeat protein
MTFGLAPLLLLFATSLVHAQEAPPSAEDEAARTHFASGRVHFDEGEYEAALREFTSAYELSHRDALLFNLYLAAERLAQLPAAIDYLERYLATDVVPADERPTLERRLENMRERVAATDASPTSPPFVSPRVHPLLVPGIVVLGVGGAGLVVFGILGGLTLSEDSRLASTCGANAGRTCSDADVAGLRSMALGADVTLAIGLVAAATGAALLIVDAATDGEQAPSAPSARLVPWGGPTGAGLVLEGTL